MTEAILIREYSTHNENINVSSFKIGSDEYIMKVYKKTSMKFNNELKIFNKLKKIPNYNMYIPKILDYFSSGKDTRILLEKGIDDMFELCRIQNMFNFREKLNIALGICNCVKFMHDNNIIHNDIKLENIVIFKENGEYIPKLIDFEFAFIGKIKSKHLMGTDMFIAPEIKDSKMKVYSKKSDIYSLGLTLFEIFDEDDNREYNRNFVDHRAYNIIDPTQNLDKHSRPDIDEVIKQMKDIIVKYDK